MNWQELNYKCGSMRKCGLPLSMSCLILKYFATCLKNKKHKRTPWHSIDIYTPSFIAALVTIAKNWNQISCLSTDEQIMKNAYIGILLRSKEL